MWVLQEIGHALYRAAAMGWLILWPLVLGFAASGVVQAVVKRERIAALMAGTGPRSVAVSTLLGAASSSCSYAAVALARSLFRKGASFTSAMVFEIASTNLVVELGLVLALTMGWQFTLAEFVAGPFMIVIVAVLFRLVLRRRIVDAARRQADEGIAGSMEGHAGMDMSVQSDAPFLRRLFSPQGLTSTAQYFVMDWAAVLRDIVIGLLIAGAFEAWVPRSFLQVVFLTDDPTLAFVLGPLIGPLIAVISFVCSVGNVPLAGVLWNGGISFGGVMSFVFADLLILPILAIYRRYYGWRATGVIVGVFYAAMAAAGYLVELLFTPLHLVPADRHVAITDSGFSWDYTTFLNIAAIAVAAFLVVRFFRSSSGPMLRMMGGSPDAEHDHDHAGHDHDHAGHDHAGHDHDHAGHDHAADDHGGHVVAAHDHSGPAGHDHGTRAGSDHGGHAH